MKERGMLFNSAMVRAILDGTKTQTRRIVKPQPEWIDEVHIAEFGPGDFMWPRGSLGQQCGAPITKMPYGQPGDRIWVRETHAPQADCWGAWQRLLKGEHVRQDELTVHYAADYSHDERPWIENWRPSIHMPRWASRIDLEITGVRVERLQDIHSADALAEGINNLSDEWRVDYGIPGVVRAQHPVRAYQLLWESINGAGSWDENPWVWVVEFKRIKP
jgi:hypothetical protein